MIPVQMESHRYKLTPMTMGIRSLQLVPCRTAPMKRIPGLRTMNELIIQMIKLTRRLGIGTDGKQLCRFTDWETCANPNTTILIVGYAKIAMTNVQNAPEKRIGGEILCDLFSNFSTRGGGGEYGVKGTIPGLVE